MYHQVLSTSAVTGVNLTGLDVHKPRKTFKHLPFDERFFCRYIMSKPSIIYNIEVFFLMTIEKCTPSEQENQDVFMVGFIDGEDVYRKCGVGVLTDGLFINSPIATSYQDTPGGKVGRCVRLTTYHLHSAGRQDNPGP